MENETRKVGLCQLVKGLKDHEFGIYPDSRGEMLEHFKKGISIIRFAFGAGYHTGSKIEAGLKRGL